MTSYGIPESSRVLLGRLLGFFRMLCSSKSRRDLSRITCRDARGVAVLLLLVFSLGGCATQHVKLNEEASTPQETATIYLPAGRIYVGPVRDGKPHGPGEITFPNGRRLLIDFNDGWAEGKGVLIFPDGSEKQATAPNLKAFYPSSTGYTGDRKNTKRHGHGQYIWPNGDVYVGQWKDDQMHGKGSFRWSTDSKEEYVDRFDPGYWSHHQEYIGEFNFGEMRAGILTFKSGNSYRGKWVSGEFIVGSMVISEEMAANWEKELEQRTYSSAMSKGSSKSSDPYSRCLGYAIGIAMIGGDTASWISNCQILYGSNYTQPARQSGDACTGLYCSQDYAWDYLPGSSQWRCRDTGGVGGGQFSASHLCSGQTRIDNWP